MVGSFPGSARAASRYGSASNFSGSTSIPARMAERRLAVAQRELERAAKALIKGTLPEDVAEKEIMALRLECDRLKIELEAVPTAHNVVSLHPATLERYEAQVARLHEALEAGCAAGDVEAAEAIRDLTETVTVKRDPTRPGGVQVEIVGRLNALLGEGAGLFASVGKVVAGARYIRQKPAIDAAFVFAA
jgi:site-specific DNA recombinase